MALGTVLTGIGKAGGGALRLTPVQGPIGTGFAAALIARANATVAAANYARDHNPALTSTTSISGAHLAAATARDRVLGGRGY